ncbi:MAG: hypothetical protein IKF10_07830, partial [Lachnospiraceae bacterium]|nr:hypothetical protein [Lachnospiraceae bacterium]
NGKASGRVFEKYQAKTLGRSSITLPSTSPTNAAWSLERLIDEWRIVKDTLEQEKLADSGSELHKMVKI